MVNGSGQGKNSPVPPEIKRWNWGAFLLNWIWGLGNNTYLALLTLAPCVGFAVPFVLGAKGSEWAWQNRRWESVEHFRRVQRTWAWSGLGAIGAAAVFAGCLILAISAVMKSSDVYQLAFSRLERDREAATALGPPLETGMVQGSISTSGPGGDADISFSVTGSRAKGKVYVNATKSMGRWAINRMEVEVAGRDERIVVVNGVPSTELQRESPP